MKRIIVPILLLSGLLSVPFSVHAAPCSYFDEGGNIHYTHVYTKDEWNSLGCGSDLAADRGYWERCCKNIRKGKCKLRKECKPKSVKKGKSKKKQKKKKR